MTSFSVKKPFTVFVAVVAILVFGVMSYVKMTPDLMPNMDYPYGRRGDDVSGRRAGGGRSRRHQADGAEHGDAQ